MNITGTHFNYYQLCHRKLWLFANGIQMEHTSDLVYEGKLIHEESYPQRAEKYKEIEIGGIKIDHYDARKKVIHEVKKSDKMDHAHTWQLKYYIYVLEKAGIEGVSGILEYPKLRKTEEVFLSTPDREAIETFMEEIEKILDSDICPPTLKISKCGKCSYFDFCWVGEDKTGFSGLT